MLMARYGTADSVCIAHTGVVWSNKSNINATAAMELYRPKLSFICGTCLTATGLFVWCPPSAPPLFAGKRDLPPHICEVTKCIYIFTTTCIWWCIIIISIDSRVRLFRVWPLYELHSIELVVVSVVRDQYLNCSFKSDCVGIYLPSIGYLCVFCLMFWFWRFRIFSRYLFYCLHNLIF